jgi:hypothetical protein
MSLEEIEAEALKLDPKARARLAEEEELLESLKTLSDQENEGLWVEVIGAMPTGTQRQAAPAQQPTCFWTLEPN